MLPCLGKGWIKLETTENEVGGEDSEHYEDDVFLCFAFMDWIEPNG